MVGAIATNLTVDLARARLFSTVSRSLVPNAQGALGIFVFFSEDETPGNFW